MLNKAEINPLQNQLLALLRPDEYALLMPHLSIASYAVGKTLVFQGSSFEHVYFPLSGMLSLVIEMQDGNGAETATVGREGAVGAIAALGFPKSQVRVTVQLPMVCARIAVSTLASIASESRPLAAVLLRSNELQFAQVRLSAACNALHHLDARFCRWILQAADRGDGGPMTLTQEFLGEMLAVQRTSVNQVAHEFQSAGMIRYSRGHIEILDRCAMETRSCECYVALQETSRNFAS
jgi:CRP-like cAMP-binding protein